MTPRQTKYQDTKRSLEHRLEHCRQNAVPVALLLDRIEDIKNAGALFRIADAANLTHIYGYKMPALLQHKKLGRVARSTQKYVPYTNLSTQTEIRQLCSKYDLTALEITDTSIPYNSFHPDKPCL